MKSTTLVIMAAGMGSRFGGGIKQLEAMGPNGEIIMDYSIYEAALSMKPDYDVEKIYELLEKNKRLA